ncbi:DNA polymerase alpha catalytic subunit isoform X1 [Cajanus cajan]|uniref:DNA polymerase alpha catalytic subunit isoform X1 n=1 Tax=Cajanus cajan TaxID=3821 RepID=UPI00098D8C61|nr:DNA polymerase alpha catalytic subunit isoform X1 [Cajanus cajan]
MADAEPVSGRRRPRGPEATARSEALERLKARLRGGRRSDDTGPQIRLENPVYDTVPEDEYNALVAKRREQARSFIVDDEGLGYGDEGEEEDWSQAGFNLSDDESEGESERPKRKKVEKKDPQPKRPSSSLSAAAAMMGGQRLSSMFTSSVFKKSRDDKASESIVDDVIAEFAPDETDRLRRRKAQTISSNVGCRVRDKPSADYLNAASLFPPSANAESVKVVVESNDFDSGLEQKCDVVSEVQELACGNGQGPMVEMEHDDCKINEGVVEEKEVKNVEIEVKTGAKKEVFSLNAKVKDEEDPALSATAGWKEAINGAGGVNAADSKDALQNQQQSEFDLEEDGSLPFYILDAYEEFYGENRGTLYLFGKVKTGCFYQSCCVIVKNMQRCVYAVLSHPLHRTEEMRSLERDVQESRVSSADFFKKLQDMVSDVKNEIAQHLVNLEVSNFSMAPVKRKYAFERSEIPAGENYVVKINYSFKDPVLPGDLKGENFCALLGTGCSALELFLIKRKIKGPSWLQVSKFSTSQRVSWCKFEVTVDSPKDIKSSAPSKITSKIPPVVVAAMSLKTIINEKQNTNEIVSASIICCNMVKIDTPMLASEWKRPGRLTHFTVIRKLDGNIFPMGFNKEVTDKNLKAGSNVLCAESSERALLNRLMLELHKLDSDVLVGHNISGFDLDVLLHRCQMQALKVGSNTWSRLGRLNRSKMPKLGRRGKTFGAGADPGIMSCLAGRLLCDTYLCSRDLLKEVSYSLTHLAKSHLNKFRKEVAPHEVPKMFQAAESLMELIEYGETDAWLSMELMFYLSILPLTRQLTNISGNLWGKTLQGGRAQRVEYLLLHTFHSMKYMVPDKFSNHAKETKLTKRKVTNDVEDSNFDVDIDDANYDNDASEADHKKSKKGPSYAGGLVLEPKKGLYDKYILLLDFNSLYPSIIQEYNICFTTVERSSDESFPRLPSSKTTGVLPEVLKNLVERRKKVKSWIKNEKKKNEKADPIRVQQLDIQQQALKLTANSMYGCLGFSNSRFYAKPLAELITLQGREILQSTVDLVQNNLNLEVIYGDTDSIMIYSGLDDIEEANKIAARVIQEVNKKYKCLEIDLDGLYKRMLLLKKKKYAAVKLMFRDRTPYEVIERKGLDIVRRDWSLLAKELGDFCLTQILSGGSCEDVVESIHNSLTKVQEEMRNGQVPLEKYVITKTLTKPPEAYPDAKNQPHVLVAQRLRQLGYSSGCSVGDTIPYIICYEQGGASGSAAGIAQRARHPDELKQEQGTWLIDIDYYLSQQIHPVVSRLCASIQGTSPERLANCLGLDSSKYHHKSSEALNDDSINSLLLVADDEERYRRCEPLILTCPSCFGTFDCPPVFKSICCLLGSEKPAGVISEESDYNFWRKLCCPKCPEDVKISPAMISNQVKRQAERFVLMYYRGLLMCDDETCKHTTRSISLRLVGDSERGTVCPNYPRCNGRLLRQYTEADLYRQLSYFCHVFDTVSCIEKMETKSRIPIEKELIKIRPMIDMAASTAQKIRDRCAFGWVRLQDLVIAV